MTNLRNYLTQKEKRKRRILFSAKSITSFNSHKYIQFFYWISLIYLRDRLSFYWFGRLSVSLWNLVNTFIQFELIYFLNLLVVQDCIHIKSQMLHEFYHVEVNCTYLIIFSSKNNDFRGSCLSVGSISWSSVLDRLVINSVVHTSYFIDSTTIHIIRVKGTVI